MPTKDDFDRYLLAIDRRTARWVHHNLELLKCHSKAVMLRNTERKDQYRIISLDPVTHKWRVSWFDQYGASGHEGGASTLTDTVVSMSGGRVHGVPFTLGSPKQWEIERCMPYPITSALLDRGQRWLTRKTNHGEKTI